MKRTKNMVYQYSDEARELFLYATNTAGLYSLSKDIIVNLRKHWKKDKYDVDKALDAWYHFMTIASKEYWKDFGYGFSVIERFTAAVWTEEDMRSYLIEEEY